MSFEIIDGLVGTHNCALKFVDEHPKTILSNDLPSAMTFFANVVFPAPAIPCINIFLVSFAISECLMDSNKCSWMHVFGYRFCRSSSCWI